MKRFLAALAAHRAEITGDLACLYALGSIGFGLWGWSPNLSLVVTGGIILAGITASRARSGSTNKRER